MEKVPPKEIREAYISALRGAREGDVGLQLYFDRVHDLLPDRWWSLRPFPCESKLFSMAVTS